VPQFSDHIDQAKRNLTFLQFINYADAQHIDWQVTVCYYVAVHLINAHLSLHNMQFRKHVDVKYAINPKSAESIRIGTALNESVYLAYIKLQSLSRRSRYLVNEKDENLHSSNVFLTHNVHYARALRHLNCLIDYFNTVQKTDIKPIKIFCDEIKNGELNYLHKAV
jgi:hypothetical protein